MTVLRVPAIRLLRCSTILEAREDFMERIQARFVGVELYFENLERAKKFYIETMGLEVSNEQVGHHAKFDSGAGFVCLERKGAESYPSKDKVVLFFFEVTDLRSAIAAIGQDRLVQSEGSWAVLHDPEGHNILLLQRSN
jgi:predicted enzyme related to lactoylglutathione lyase